MKILFDWDETLPQGCPPKDAKPPENKRFFRLVESIPPLESDFWSQRKHYPKKKFKTTECIARSCSIFTELNRCADIRKLPLHKNKKVVELTLTPESGLIKNTGRHAYHYSWWKVKGFNPIPYCVEIK
jgi:hypothetical protein